MGGGDADASLATHFQTKRRILTTVQDMEARGEKLEEATPEEIMEVAQQKAETVFRFQFSLSDDAQADEEDAAAAARKKKRNQKKKQKRRAKKAEQGTESERASVPAPVAAASASASAPAPAANEETSCQKKAKKKKKAKKPPASSTTAATTGSSGASFFKLRKAADADSEMARMHLRYGQGRRNLAAIAQHEQRRKNKAHSGVPSTNAGASSGTPAGPDAFKFNFDAEA